MRNEKPEGNAINWWLAAGALLVIAGAWYFAQSRPAPAFEGTGPSASPEASPTLGTPAAPAQAGIGEAAAGSEIVLGAPAPADLPTAQTPSCGDGICGSNERCDTCPQDCGCTLQEYCSNDTGVCLPTPV